ncbi:MAG: NAD(P)-binding domain-containing protein [Burkholderiales bacterium]|nr:NAD(P)-binding domain-containing protein [Burkholderiales bacterium]
MTMTVGIVGVGAMGGPIAGHIAQAGHRVVGYDPDPQRQAVLTALGGKLAASVGAAVAEADISLLLLPTPKVMDDVVQEIAARARGRAGPRMRYVPDRGQGARARSARRARHRAARLPAERHSRAGCGEEPRALRQRRARRLRACAAGHRGVYRARRLRRPVRQRHAHEARRQHARRHPHGRRGRGARAGAAPRPRPRDRAPGDEREPGGDLRDAEAPRRADGRAALRAGRRRLAILAKDARIIAEAAAEVGADMPLFAAAAARYNAAYAKGRPQQDAAVIFEEFLAAAKDT